MTKFKVGDKALILRSNYGCESLQEGMVAEVAIVEDGFVFFNGTYADGDTVVLSFDCGWLQKVEDLESNIIQLNQTYTSKNGHKWECIGIKDGIAWLAGEGDGDAYRFLLNGENLSQGGGLWDIKWEPVVEWVTEEAELHNKLVHIDFPLIDGKPDFTQATVTPV